MCDYLYKRSIHTDIKHIISLCICNNNIYPQKIIAHCR